MILKSFCESTPPPTFLGLIFLILGTGIGDNGHRGGSKSRLQHGAAWGRGHVHSAISNAAPARLGDRIWPCERLPPVGKEVIDPVGLTLFVQAIYEAFTAGGISFYDQPSENADSWKSKREKEKHCQWWYTWRFSDSLT
jgi:hypothetical protein